MFRQHKARGAHASCLPSIKESTTSLDEVLPSNSEAVEYVTTGIESAGSHAAPDAFTHKWAGLNQRNGAVSCCANAHMALGVNVLANSRRPYLRAVVSDQSLRVTHRQGAFPLS
jgi:hypothetical protein